MKDFLRESKAAQREAVQTVHFNTWLHSLSSGAVLRQGLSMYVLDVFPCLKMIHVDVEEIRQDGHYRENWFRERSQLESAKSRIEQEERTFKQLISARTDPPEVQFNFIPDKSSIIDDGS